MLDSPKQDMNTRQPDLYKSCDIIEFIDGEDAEGLQLANLFTSNEVKYIIKHACDYPSIDSLFADFTNCVLKRNSDARQNSEPLYMPELHLSCHGCEQGIGWPDGSLISWSTLAKYLWQLSQHLGYVTSPSVNGAFAQTTSLLSLSLSCCSGAHAKEHFFSSEPYPVGGFTAPTDTIYISDCTQFFLRLYTLQIENPWDVKEKVDRIQKDFMPQGPNGSASIQCFNAPLSPNLNYKPPLEI